MLFDERERLYIWHKTRKLSNFEFLDISAWDICVFLRPRLNHWGVDFEHDADFISKFKSRLPKQFYGAEFELLLHNMLKNKGWEIKRHPDLGTSKRLDFKLNLPDATSVLLECTLAGNSFENTSDKTQKEIIEEIIDELEYYPYYINVTYNKISTSNISKKRLVRFFDDKRKKSEGIENEQLLHMPDSFNEDGWELDFTMLRKPVDKPIQKRSLGYMVNRARSINTSKPLLTALKDKKPSKYGEIEWPYVICVNTSDLFASDNAYYEALFGQFGPGPILVEDTRQEGLFLGGKSNNTRK